MCIKIWYLIESIQTEILIKAAKQETTLNYRTNISTTNGTNKRENDSYSRNETKRTLELVVVILLGFSSLLRMLISGAEFFNVAGVVVVPGRTSELARGVRRFNCNLEVLFFSYKNNTFRVSQIRTNGTS